MKFELRILLGLFFVGVGITHFILQPFFLRMMPPSLPLPLVLIYISGAAEIFLGLMLLAGRNQVLTRWGLILLLLAVFPANVRMAMAPEAFPEFSAASLYLRLPIQLVLIGLVWIATETENRSFK